MAKKENNTWSSCKVRVLRTLAARIPPDTMGSLGTNISTGHGGDHRKQRGDNL